MSFCRLPICVTLHPPAWKVPAAWLARPEIIVSFRTTSGSFTAAALAADAGDDDALVEETLDDIRLFGAEVDDVLGLGADEDGARVSLPASVP